MIRKVKLEALECTCERCRVVWIAKPVREGKKWITPLPVACTSCKSAYWNRPKKEKNKAK